MVTVLAMLLKMAVVMAPHRKPPGLVPGNLKADRVFELRGLHCSREEDGSAHSGAGGGEQDNHVLCCHSVLTVH